MPTVSIIIPVYNVVSQLPFCIDSILAQTIGDYEVLLIDDGSTDGTGIFCDTLSQRSPRFRVFHQEHCGVSVARNRGIKDAKSDYVTFIDGDDYVHPQYIEVLLSAITSGNYALAMSPLKKVCQQAFPMMPVDSKELRTTALGADELMRGLYAGIGGMENENFIVAAGKIYRREILHGLSFPDDVKVLEDAVFNNLIYQRTTNAVYVECSLYFWYQRAGSAVHDADKSKVMQRIDAFRICYHDIPADMRRYRAYCIERIYRQLIYTEIYALKYHLLPEFRPDVRETERSVRKAFMKARLPISTKIHHLAVLHIPVVMAVYARKYHISREEKAHIVQAPRPKTPNETISVIVPVFNVAPYLPISLDSILGQTYRHIEVILVDDGSTDGSSQICDDYAARDARITVIHQQNKGCAAARNAGLRIYTGGYVIMIDGDDYIHPQMLGALHKALTKGDFAFAMAWGKRVVGKMQTFERLSSARLTMMRQPKLIEGLTQHLADGVYYTVLWNKLFRRETVQGLLLKEVVGSDILFVTMAYMRTYQMVLVDKPLYYWVQRQGSITHQPLSRSYVDRLFTFYLCLCALPRRNEKYRGQMLEFLYSMMGAVLSKTRHDKELYRYARLTVKRICSFTRKELLCCPAMPMRKRMMLYARVVMPSLFPCRRKADEA